ncbi:hypothetical protein GGS20DRAFT_586464 [Poronia punctata]|nr:hypothetical protein GGS20DRAFT_586464 [Poronia punctata]
MSSNSYEMNGFLQMPNPSYELDGDIPTNQYSQVGFHGETSWYDSSSQLDLDMSRQLSGAESLPGAPGARPLRSSSMPNNGAGPSCPFYSEVLDDCSKARLYARMLEYYLLDSHSHESPVACPIRNCPARNFKHPKDMFRHFKTCKLFEKGEFWCPACKQFETFKVRSSKKCSWNKENNIGRKIIQKSKDMFHKLGANPLATQQAGGRGLCAVCSSPFAVSVGPAQNSQSVSNYHPGTMQFARPYQGYQYPSPSTVPNGYYELDSANVIPELAPESQWSELPDMPMTAPVYKSARPAVSEVSLLTSSLHHSPLNISPASSAHVDESPVDYPNHGGELYPPISYSGLLHDTPDHVVALGTGIPTYNPPSRNVRSMVPAHMTHAMIPTQPTTPTTLPVTLRRATTHIGLPMLRVQTPQSRLHLSVPTAHHPMTPTISQPLNDPMSADSSISTDLMEQIPTSSISDTPLMTSQNSPLSPYNAPRSATSTQSTTSSNFSSQPELSPFTNSPTELKCDICNFVPTGKNKPSYLRKHQKTHEGIKFPCEHCSKTYSRQDNLTKHVKEEHNIHPSKRRRDSRDSLQTASSHVPKKKGVRAHRARNSYNSTKKSDKKSTKKTKQTRPLERYVAEPQVHERLALGLSSKRKTQDIAAWDEEWKKAGGGGGGGASSGSK